ncbi:MAG: hypothetical protein ACPIOQ_31080 [Promethearchaeia archaeon]
MIQPDLSAERSEGECGRWIAARTILGRCNPGVIAYGTTDPANAQHKDVPLHRPLSTVSKAINRSAAGSLHAPASMLVKVDDNGSNVVNNFLLGTPGAL